MGLAQVQTPTFAVGTHGAITLAIAYPGNVTAGNLLVAAAIARTDTNPPTLTIADSLTQTYLTAKTLDSVGLAGRATIFDFPNTAGGANTVTITQGLGAGNRERMFMTIYEISGADTATPAGNTSGTTLDNTTTDPSAGNATSTIADAVFIGECLWYVASGADMTGGSGYTLNGAGNSGAGDDLKTYAGMQSRIETGTGTFASPFTVATHTGEYWVAIQAIFQAAAAAGGGRSLFLRPPLNGIGVGGSFFANPLGKVIVAMQKWLRGLAYG